MKTHEVWQKFPIGQKVIPHASARPGDSGLHGAQFHAQDDGYLFVGETVDIAQDEGFPLLRRQRLKPGLDHQVQGLKF